VLRSLPGGWRNSVMPPERAVYRHGPDPVEVSYRPQRDGGFAVRVTGPGGGAAQLTAHVTQWDGGWLSFAEGGRSHRRHVLRRGDRVWVQGPDGDVELTAVPRFPQPQQEAVAGGLVAPMPGTVLEVRVAPGDQVSAGQLVMIVEAMKMEHRITAPGPGAVAEVRASRGDQVAAGDVLVVIDAG